MSRKGNCYDNACIESFHSVIKRELTTTEESTRRASRRTKRFLGTYRGLVQSATESLAHWLHNTGRDGETVSLAGAAVGDLRSSLSRYVVCLDRRLAAMTLIQGADSTDGSQKISIPRVYSVDIVQVVSRAGFTTRLAN